MIFFLALAQSCTDMDKTLGENFIPEGQRLQVKLFDASDFCSFSTVRPEDSIVTSYYPNGDFAYGVLGVHNDPRLGRTQAGFAVTFAPYEYGFDFGDTVAGFDSVYLVLDFSSQSTYGLNTTASMEVEVYELTQNLSDTLSYYGVRKFEENTGFDISTIAGTENLVEVGRGTLTYGATEAYIKLSDDLLLSKLWSNMSSAESFAAAFKGLYVTVKNDGVSDGCIKYADVISTSSYTAASTLRAYYHPVDTVARYYSYYVYGQCFNYFQHDYKALGQPNDSVLYMQGLGGVATQLTFRLDSIREWVGERSIAVNRAELIFPVEDSEDYSAVDAYATAMNCVALTSSGYRNILDFSNSAFGGGLNRSQMKYSVNITHAFSEALPKQIGGSLREGVSKPMLMVPSGYISDASSIFIGNKEGKKPQLKIWYSEIK